MPLIASSSASVMAAIIALARTKPSMQIYSSGA